MENWKFYKNHLNNCFKANNVAFFFGVISSFNSAIIPSSIFAQGGFHFTFAFAPPSTVECGAFPVN